MQGVGFRPFVYRLAISHGISGWVRNRRGEVEILACGRASDLAAFRRDLVERAPPLARPVLVAGTPAAANDGPGFDILPSRSSADARVHIPPDYFMCDDCCRELHDPGDRRHRYPFINCTQCGPRYTLIESLPYDRANTSMAEFPLCPACAAEYRDPADRRFHAEPVACPACGPSLHFEAAGTTAVEGEAALAAALACLRGGNILAVRGIGGYHLLCDAARADAVQRLRQRKQRPEKPLAVMFPLGGEDGLAELRRAVRLDTESARRLLAPDRPIVLARALGSRGIAANVAPGLTELGVFLPYSPLHELLLADFGRPVVATSGNLGGEPVLTRRRDAARRLGTVADAFLHHDRRIVRPADDSVLRRIAGRLRPVRLGRGATPLELELPVPLAEPVLAVGAHMKGTIALGWGDRAVLSPHIGEMDSPRSLEVLERIAADLQRLYGIEARWIACDAHPRYGTHRFAEASGLPVETVWHHRAHASALAAECRPDEALLAFTWDGVGLGEDGSLWGGEALLGGPGAWRRVASLRPFRLPGGERAGREPWRSAAALMWEAGLRFEPAADRDGLAAAAWRRNLNCASTSSAGRLFDAAAALLLGIDTVSFEAAGPMRLEAACEHPGTPQALPLAADPDGILRSDWAPLLARLTDRRRGAHARAEDFHASLAGIVVDQARALRELHGVRHVGLCGGVFQNRVLTAHAANRLTAEGFRVHLPERLPANDAAISVGQLLEVAARQAGSNADG